MTTTVFPTIHLNGTSRATLVEENIAAANAIDDAILKIHGMEFNALEQAKAHFDRIAEHCAA